MTELSFTLPAYTSATRGTRCPSCGQTYRDDSEPNIPILLYCGHAFCFTCLEASFTSQLANAPHTCRCPTCADLVYASPPRPEQVFWLRAAYNWEHAFMMVRVELSDEPPREPQEHQLARPPAAAAALRLAIPFHPAPGSRGLEAAPPEPERALAFHPAGASSAASSAPATPTIGVSLSDSDLTPQQSLLPTQGERRRRRRRSRKM